MGVKSLWKILDESGIGETGKLSSLQGQKVAIDISGWIVQSQLVNYGYRIRKPYLSNLFWRVSHLLQHQVEPVFVIDGDTPSLKYEEMKRRSQLEKSNRAPNLKRGHLKELTKECCELLDCLGLPWITAKGEGEATCAWLDKCGYVAAIISDDSDCFAHGARTVYRNFTASENQVSFKEYTATKIKEKLSLEVPHLVGLAMLLGCDYGYSGVNGVGKETAFPWIQKVQDPIKRFSEWRDNASYYEHLELGKSFKNITGHCTKCKHEGSMGSHAKCGCTLCVTSSGCHRDNDVGCSCEFHRKRSLYIENAVELKLRSQALKDENFPNKEIIDAFLNFEVPMTTMIESLTWKSPDYKKLKVFLQEKLLWSDETTTRRVMPILVNTEMKYHTKQVQPQKILKSCMRRNKPMYLVEWTLTDSSAGSYTQVVAVSKEQFHNNFSEMAAIYQKGETRKQKAASKHLKKIKSTQPSQNQSTMTDFFKVNKVKRRLFEDDQTSHSKNANNNASSQESYASNDDDKTSQLESQRSSLNDLSSDYSTDQLKSSQISQNDSSDYETDQMKSSQISLNDSLDYETAQLISLETSLGDSSDDETIPLKSLETSLNLSSADETSPLKLSGISLINSSFDATSQLKSSQTSLNDSSDDNDETNQLKSSEINLNDSSDVEITHVFFPDTNLSSTSHKNTIDIPPSTSRSIQNNQNKEISHTTKGTNQMSRCPIHNHSFETSPLVNKRKNGRVCITRLCSPESSSPSSPKSPLNKGDKLKSPFMVGDVFKSPECSVSLQRLDLGTVKRKLFDDDNNDTDTTKCAKKKKCLKVNMSLGWLN